MKEGKYMCIFCKIVNGEIPSYKVYEDDDILAFLDISQVTKGHTIVICKKHVTNILDSDKDTYLKVVAKVYDLANQITKNLDTKGVNILHNANEVAGQSVDHLHFHIIPRYSNDDSIKIHFEESEKQDMDLVLKQIKGE